MSKGMNRREFVMAGTAAGLSVSVARAASITADPDVIVIGAGLSGLNAASLVEELGARVLCLEGRNRPGGRLLSHQTVAGNPEWGGDSILGAYARMQDTARRLDIPLVDHHARRDMSPEAHRDPARVELALGGEIIPREEWPTHPLNAMPAGARDRFPGRGFFQSVIAEHNPLASFGDWAIWAPGQVIESLPALIEPANRVHFCGEHTATSNRGMEGAMESGERVAFEVWDLL